MIELKLTVSEAETILAALREMPSHDDMDHLMESKRLETLLEKEIELEINADPATL